MKLAVHVRHSHEHDTVQAWCPDLVGCSATAATEPEALDLLRRRIDQHFAASTKRVPAGTRLVMLTLFVAAVLAGCATTPDDPDAAPSVVASQLSPTDATAVLSLVNYPGTTAALLDTQVGLDARAAKNIIAHRNGPDGIAPSADDVLFTSIDDLDAIPYVGDSAFTKMTAYAETHPLPAPETVEGVAFAGWESQTVVWGVDHLDLSVLDGFLDARAANGLVNKRPFTTVAQMGPISYVGATALKALRAHAQQWWSLMQANSTTDLAGVFDGVSFDEPTAEVALQIANGATAAQFASNGVNATGGAKIIAARSYTTVAAIAAVPGVGAATMKELHAYAASGAWVAFTLDATALAADQEMVEETLVEDEGFAEYIQSLAGADPMRVESDAIFTALNAEIVKLTAPLLGTTYPDSDTAFAAVAAAAAPVKADTKASGWAYLETLGLAQPGTSTCSADFIANIGPHLPPLLFLSESDRPFDIVVFAGAGTTAPTAASVLALVNAEAGSTSQERDPNDYYGDLEPMGSPDALAVQAVFGTLTDVVYVAVFKPASDEFNAEVDVYLLGRNSCGDLVGIHAISIET